METLAGFLLGPNRFFLSFSSLTISFFFASVVQVITVFGWQKQQCFSG